MHLIQPNLPLITHKNESPSLVGASYLDFLLAPPAEVALFSCLSSFVQMRLLKNSPSKYSPTQKASETAKKAIRCGMFSTSNTGYTQMPPK